MNLVKLLRITFLKNMYERLLLKTCEQTKEKWRQNLLFVWSSSIIKIKFLGQFPPGQLPPYSFSPDNCPLDNCSMDNCPSGQLTLGLFPPRNIVLPPGYSHPDNYCLQQWQLQITIFSWLFSVSFPWPNFIISVFCYDNKNKT